VLLVYNVNGDGSKTALHEHDRQIPSTCCTAMVYTILCKKIKNNSDLICDLTEENADNVVAHFFSN